MELKPRRKALNPINTKSSGEAAAEATGGEAEEPLSPAGRLFHTANFNCHIIATIGLNSPINPETIKTGLLQTLIKHPRFSSTLVEDKRNGGKMRWVATKVNIEKHVIVPKLASAGDSPDETVGDYITSVTATPMDLTRPLWELHLLNTRTSDAEATAVLRIHHSVGDGASLISLLLACTRQSSDPDALPTVPGGKRNPRTARSGGILGILSAIWWTLRLILNTFVDLMLFVATIVFLKDTETPIKGAIGVELKPKKFVHRILSLDDIKLVKQAMNSTINDVVLGVTQAGLCRYLNRRFENDGKEGGAKQKKNGIPENIRVRSTILVNIRPTAGIQDLADMMAKESKGKWGNGIAYVILPFTIRLQDDPLDYVRTAKATIDRKKRSLEAICSYSIALMILKSFGLKVAAALSNRVMYNTTLSFSNIMGPQEEVCFYGHPIAYIAPSVYGHPHALTFHYQSYANKMVLSVTVDPDVIPDPYQLCDDLEDSLKLITNRVAEK